MTQPEMRASGHAPKPLARLLGLLPVALTLAVMFVALDALEDIYDAVKSGGAADSVDLPVQAWMVAHRQPWLDTMATGYTHLGGKVGMPIIATTVVLAGAAAGLAWALAAVLGHWIYVRLRTKDRAATVRQVAQRHRREVAEARAG